MGYYIRAIRNDEMVARVSNPFHALEDIFIHFGVLRYRGAFTAITMTLLLSWFHFNEMASIVIMVRDWRYPKYQPVIGAIFIEITETFRELESNGCSR
jgi:hypothetical protein